MSDHGGECPKCGTIWFMPAGASCGYCGVTLVAKEQYGRPVISLQVYWEEVEAVLKAAEASGDEKARSFADRARRLVAAHERERA